MLSVKFTDGTVFEYAVCHQEYYSNQGTMRDALRIILVGASYSLDDLRKLYEDNAKTEAILLTNDAVPVYGEDGLEIVRYETVSISYTGYSYPLGVGIDAETNCAFLRLGKLTKSEINQPFINTLLSGISDEEAADQYAMLFEEWLGNGVRYIKNDRREFGGWLYKCLQSHQSQPDWTPLASPSLWVNIAAPDEEYPLIDNPIKSTNPWMQGEKGRTEDGKKWVSLIHNNVWQPNDYPQGWALQN